jgi:hypothetical protein
MELLDSTKPALDPATGKYFVQVVLAVAVDEFGNPHYNRTMIENELGKRLLELLKKVLNE